MKTKVLEALRISEAFILDELAVRNRSFIPGPTEEERRCIGCAEVALEKIRGAIREVSGPDETREALRLFVDRMDHYGNWEDGCFYYSRVSASELQKPIEKARAILEAA